MKWRDPDEAQRRLFELAQGQAGHFTATQALEAGYSRRLQHYHAHRGHWLRIERGLYRLRDFPSGPHEDLVRWALWSRGLAVISHETAAAVHELGDVLPARVHLTVAPGFRKEVPPGVILHRARLTETDIQASAGFRLTAPLRTVLDLLASGCESDQLGRVVHDALERGAIRRAELEVAILGLDEALRERGRCILRLAAAEEAHAL